MKPYESWLIKAYHDLISAKNSPRMKNQSWTQPFITLNNAPKRH
jgi:hypothetical protein